MTATIATMRCRPRSLQLLALAAGCSAGAATSGGVDAAAFNPFGFKAAAAPGMDGWFKDAKLGMFPGARLSFCPPQPGWKGLAH